MKFLKPEVKEQKIFYFSEALMPCYFCQRNVKEIDFKDTELLKKFISGLAKIRAKKRTGACSHHQKKLAKAIKIARHLGLLPHTTK